ncbi:OmpA family protein [Lentzea guizhouensis]|nr:OmpA family protein [Lentzea guizhouensis]
MLPVGAGAFIALAGIIALLASLIDSQDGGASSKSCGGDTNAVTLAMSNRQNSPKLVRNETLETFLKPALDVRFPGPISAVVLDGYPKLVAEHRAKAGDPGLRYGQTGREFAQKAAEVRAEQPEADVLAALDTAARANGSGSGRGGLVVLVDSGLSTTGAVSFDQNTTIDVEIPELVQSLRDKGHLPDLTGKAVVFVGIGEVAPPQEKLRPAQRRHLTELWKAIATASGASCVLAVDQVSLGNPPDGLPRVRTVPVPGPPLSSPSEDSFVLALGGEATFTPDTATLVDSEATRRALRQVVDAAQADPASRITVTGTTSGSGPKDTRIQLSRARARTIGDILVSSGIERERLTINGVGSDFPEYVNDIDANGNVIPGLAQKNRTVRISITPG